MLHESFDLDLALQDPTLVIPTRHDSINTMDQERRARERKQAIAALPVIPVDIELARQVCSVCVECFRIGSEVRSLTCLHVFHDHCISAWFVHRSSCPLCRFEVLFPPPNQQQPVALALDDQEI